MRQSMGMIRHTALYALEINDDINRSTNFYCKVAVITNEYFLTFMAHSRLNPYEGP